MKAQGLEDHLVVREATIEQVPAESDSYDIGITLAKAGPVSVPWPREGAGRVGEAAVVTTVPL